jgi:zinc protease
MAESMAHAVRQPASLETELVRKLNRGVRRPHARLAFEGELPFGPALRLRRYRLGNGLELLFLVDRSAPVVSYHTWYQVGSRDEEPGKTGLAHMLEHLMFGATRRHPLGEFDRLCEQAGAEANAATWTDWTYYYENLPKDALPLAVELESDRMHGLTLHAPEFESEREVVENERRYRVDDDVEGSSGEALYGLAFKRHPYRWPTIGFLEDIRGYRLADVQRFYRRWYAPNNATVVIAGDFDPEEALRLVKAHYGAIPPARVPKRALAPEPRQRRERRIALRKPASTEKVQVGYRAPALVDADYAALTVLSEILLGGRSSRVQQRLVHELEPCNEARGGIAPFAEPGLLDVWLSMREGQTAAKGLAAFDAELRRVAREKVRPEELEKAQNRLELAFLHGMETAGGKAEQIGFYRSVAGDPGAVFAQLEAYRRVTADHVLGVAQRYLSPERRSVVRVRPDGRRRAR